MAKRRAGSRTTSLTPTTKSQDSTRNTWLQRTCNIPLERSQRDLQFCSRPHCDPRSARKVMGLQSRRVPFDAISGFPAGNPGKNNHLDVASVESCRVYYKGEVVSFPKGEGAGFPTKRSEVVAYSRARSVCVFKVNPSSPVACPNTKRFHDEF